MGSESLYFLGLVKKSYMLFCSIYQVTPETRIVPKNKEGWLPQQQRRNICNNVCSAGTIVLLSIQSRLGDVCCPPTAQGERSQFFQWVYSTKSPCSKKVPLPPEHLKLHSYMINGQDIQCVHSFLQSYLANAGTSVSPKLSSFLSCEQGVFPPCMKWWFLACKTKQSAKEL